MITYTLAEAYGYGNDKIACKRFTTPASTLKYYEKQTTARINK